MIEYNIKGLLSVNVVDHYGDLLRIAKITDEGYIYAGSCNSKGHVGPAVHLNKDDAIAVVDWLITAFDIGFDDLLKTMPTIIDAEVKE